MVKFAKSRITKTAAREGFEHRMRKMSEEISEQAKDAPKDVNQKSSELRESRWAVISFDKVIAADLAYDAATKVLQENLAKKVVGLCIITNEAAARMKHEKE